MKGIGKQGGKSSSVAVGLGISATIEITMTLLFSAIIAYHLKIEKLSWDQAGYWIMGMLFATAFTGAKIAIFTVKRQRIVISLMSAALYWGLLLCFTALFFGGSWGAVWETAAIIVAGSGSAALTEMPRQKKAYRKNIRKSISLS